MDLLRDPGDLIAQAQRNPLRTLRRLRAAGYAVAISAYPDSECTPGLPPYQVLISRSDLPVCPRVGATTFTQAFRAAVKVAIQVAQR